MLRVRPAFADAVRKKLGPAALESLQHRPDGEVVEIRESDREDLLYVRLVQDRGAEAGVHVWYGAYLNAQGGVEVIVEPTEPQVEP